MSADGYSKLQDGAIDVLHLFKKVRRGHKDWSALCPAHPDTKASLSIARADDRWLLHCHRGCTVEAITGAIGLTVADLFFDKRNVNGSQAGETYERIVEKTKKRPEIIAEFVYETADGEPYLLVQRTAEKQFLQARWIKGEGWLSGKPAGPKIPYKLPELLASESLVYICEGERDADRLASLGLIATSASEGAEKWTSDLNQHFMDRDVVILADNDTAGRNHARQVATNLKGIAARIRVVDLPSLPPKGDVSDWLDAGNTIEAVHAIVDATPDETQREWVSPLGEWDAGDDDEPIPPRSWLLGNIFCREFSSSILGPGAVGKTALRYVQYLSLATGRPLTGDHVFQRSRVLIISLEDGTKELKRRIKAARIHHGITAADLAGWLFLSAPRTGIGKLVEIDKQGNAAASRLASVIKETVVHRNIDLVAIDPFVKAAGVEENSNTLIDVAMTVLTDLAIEHNLAIDCPHHTRKGTSDPGNADTGRGASAQKDAGRLVYTLSTMTPEEAQTFGVTEKDRRSLIRMDSAKVNIAPPLSEARWFRLVGVRLGNETALYPHGDEVQTVERWTPPDTWERLGSVLLNSILSEIDAGLPNGNRYSDGPNVTDRAAWRVVMKHAPDKTERQAREIIKIWVKNGVLIRQEYENPTTRKNVSGLRLDNTKRPS